MTAAEGRAEQLLDVAIRLRGSISPVEMKAFETYLQELKKDGDPDWSISIFEVRSVVNLLVPGASFWEVVEKSNVEDVKVLVVLRSMVEDWSSVRLRKQP